MNCPNGHLSTSSDCCSVCGAKMSADSEPAAPADSSLNAPATAPPAVSDLSSSELTGTKWRIECRVFKESSASAEDAARGTYESEFELVLKDAHTLIGRTAKSRICTSRSLVIGTARCRTGASDLTKGKLPWLYLTTSFVSLPSDSRECRAPFCAWYFG
jgi:hypothetical protein